jgi:hypothetical protein
MNKIPNNLLHPVLSLKMLTVYRAGASPATTNTKKQFIFYQNVAPTIRHNILRLYEKFGHSGLVVERSRNHRKVFAAIKKGGHISSPPNLISFLIFQITT